MTIPVRAANSPYHVRIESESGKHSYAGVDSLEKAKLKKTKHRNDPGVVSIDIFVNTQLQGDNIVKSKDLRSGNDTYRHGLETIKEETTSDF